MSTFKVPKALKLNSFFRKLPLPVKLILTGIIPIAFIIYLSVQLFIEKSQEVKLIGDYIERIHESGNISKLMDAMQAERRYSFEYALTKEKYDSITVKRRYTDSALLVLEKSKDLALANFREYTFLKNLPAVRRALDTSKNYSANAVMQFYTNAIFRLNTLNTTAPSSSTYLSSTYQDLIAQKLLFEMITFLNIIRTNVYNVLYTRQYMVETLMGTLGVHDVYKTYEIEFKLKASPISLQRYNYLSNFTDLKPTVSYLDKLFSTFKFDSSYTATSWWTTSTNGVTELRKLQRSLWSSVEVKMNDIYKNKTRQKNITLFFLITALVLVIAFITYTIKVISEILSELKIAANKISNGSTNINFKNMPNDVLGKVAQSILEISENNKKLAHAADAIGKGNFRIEIAPRGEEDLLGNSIVQMKNDLLQYSLQKDKIQNETLDLVNKKDDFMNIASHELKTPVTSLKAYTQILQLESAASGNKKSEMMLEKMDAQINKLALLISDLLDTSKLREGELIYNRQPVKFDELVTGVIDDIQGTSLDHKIILQANAPALIYADKERIGQVISNLLTNAIKYCNDHDIIVNVNVADKKVICSVHDDGIGIPEDQQDKIFDRFYRVASQNSHTYPGIGLGLYISKEIICRHEGEIWVESEYEKGTTFYFALPVAEG
jgi:signal transduction histidine kinase